MQKFAENLLVFAIILLIIAGFTWVIRDTGARMHRYEIKHNCRYDYNDLCYTKEQRPWLFKD